MQLEQIEKVETRKPVAGDIFAGGFFSGSIQIGTAKYFLVVAPADEGECNSIEWNDSYQRIEGAMSFDDGAANTSAMAAAGSKLAHWAKNLRIGGFDDWYIPAQDELEIIYRTLKPTTQLNYQWARSGINLSAVPPTRPYSENEPLQTAMPLFQSGAEQAFRQEWYWTSTQLASYSDYAWVQSFSDGRQCSGHKSVEFRARAVRRVLVIE